MAEIIDDVQRDGVNDRYVQYKVFLSTADGVQKPIVTDVSLGYNMIELPQVSTEPATNITGSTALGHATVIVTGGENVTRYIQWGTISGSYVGSCSAGVGASGTYACTMSGLLPNTTYYMRARVTNSAGAANGNEVSFHTAIVPSSISTRAVSDITVASAMGNGRVTASGGENPERFIQWGTQSGVYTHECSAGVGGTGYYACAMTGLEHNTTYYVRAKAVTSYATAYSTVIKSFTTKVLPDITIQDPNADDIQGAVSGGI